MRVLSTNGQSAILAIVAASNPQAVARLASWKCISIHAMSDPTAELESRLSAQQGLWSSRRIRAAFLDQSNLAR